VKLVQFNKQIAQLKEEKTQMNMGLEAKQQELELVGVLYVQLDSSTDSSF
jgi:hypothetical protein